LTAQDCLPNKTLTQREPGLKFSISSLAFGREGLLIMRPRTQPISLVEKRTDAAMTFNVQGMVRSCAQEDQID